MPTPRNRNVLRAGKPKYFHDEINVSLDGSAQIHKIPTSKSWYFKMWIPEESRQLRKSLKTDNQEIAYKLGQEEHAKVLGMTSSGKKLFGAKFPDACQVWLEFQMERVKTGNITRERHTTLKSQINGHIVPYVRWKFEKNYKVGSLKYNDFYDYDQYRRRLHPEVKEVTIRNEHTTIGSLMRWCFRQGYSHFEKCEYEELKVDPLQDRRDAFTPEEWKTLYVFLRQWVKEIPEYRTVNSNMMPLMKKDFMRNFILLGGNNLMRVGELRKLQWGMTKTFQKGKYWYTDYKLPAEICKNRKDRHFISRGGEYLNRVKRFSNYTDKGDIVFCNNDDGKPISKTEFYRMWWDIMRNVPIEGLSERKITPYSLRHTGITFRMYSGVSHYNVAKDAGTSVRYIEQHYEHYDPTKLINNAFKDFKLDKHGIVHEINRNTHTELET